MVAIGRLAVAGLAASAQALSLIPSLGNIFAANLHALVDSDQTTIKTFPDDDQKPIPGNSPIIQCDAKTPQLLEITKVVLDPATPVKGENLTFVAEGFLKQDITDGAYVEVDVRYGFIRLIHQTYDLCSEVHNVDLECPIKKGAQVISKEVAVPEEVPPGKYIVLARAYTKEDVLISCLTATVEFPPN